ncbi:MAG: hypothetical protein P4L55_04540 [Syntrophobacteraceae bacterium]|nr:hypothetical protein [Syntrophobacteraceae bacterium]
MNGERGTVQTSKLAVGSGNTVAEAIVGLGALALAIIGLANIYPWLLASIATIALGAAFVFEAGDVGRRFSSLVTEEQTVRSGSWSAWGGMTVGFLGGCAGIALGVLSILGIVPHTLVPAAVIVYGAALVMDSGTKSSLSEMENEHFGVRGVPQEIARESASTLSGIQMLAGLGAITLGILAIIKIVPETLTLVGLLAVGAAVLMAGSLVSRYVSFRRSY